MASQTQNDRIPIGDFNFGGLADSKWSGVKNSLYKFIGFDPHSAPGVLRVAQKLTKDSGTTVTEFCKERVVSTNGRTYWFSSTTGKIWERASDGTWTLVFTTTAAAGEVKCLGAFEYQGYIYWATQSRLHRILATDAEGASEWTANAALNWATFSATDASFHPMIELNLVLYIGDGKYVAQVDAGVFTADALDISSPLRIKSLGKIKTDLLIGTYVDNSVNKTSIYRWDTYSPSFSVGDEIDEVGINAFIPGDNVVFVQAGLAGRIYVYNGESLELYKTIPGDYSTSKTAIVHPGSVGKIGEEIFIGLSNVSNNPADEGVYRLGRHDRNYDWILDLPYPISERSGGAFVLTGIEIGAVAVVAGRLFVAWKNGSSYGVDAVDTSYKLDGAYFETRVMRPDRAKLINYAKFSAFYASLPDSTAINIAYSKNYAGYTDTTEKTDTQMNEVYADSEGVEAATLQLKVTVTVSGNNAPEIESAAAFVR